MIEAGKILQNRYRIEKQIGQGGMGTVFVAVDERFGSTVAIKETVFEETNLIKAFEREARLLNSLKHPALPKVSDYFTEENGQFIVMEFIAGEDLSEIMERSDKPFPLDEVLNWTDQLCDALKYLHTQDMPVIHRDIKPQNLKLTPAGQIILLDFGLAKGNPSDASHKTQAKSIFGYSRNYASLEQIQGTGTDPQSDLYSLGATVYHLMTGIPPADALTRAMNVLNGKSDPLIPANLVNKKIPGGVAHVLRQTMALNAGERPASAVEMRLMLENCDKTIDSNAADAESESVFAPGLLTQKTKLMSRETKLNEAAESEVNTEISRTDNSGEKSAVTQVGRHFAAIPHQSRRGFLFGGALLSGLIAVGGFAYFMSNPAENNSTRGVTDQVQQQNLPSNTAVAVAGSETEKEDSNVSVEIKAPELDVKDDHPAKDETKSAVENGKNQGEAPKSSVNTPKNSVTAGSRAPKEMVIETDEGKVTVFGDRFETEDFIMDDKGIKFKNPGKFPGVPKIPFNPEYFKRMTPEQRQKLAEAIEDQKRLRELEKPVPVPPKKPPADNKDN